MSKWLLAIHLLSVSLGFDDVRAVADATPPKGAKKRAKPKARKIKKAH
jgi:hypothetical protein